jgi:hypothetical protein
MSDYPPVTFTMTCGRRPALFRRTMDSFLAGCLDQDLICRWLVSDDRSLPDDLRMMQEAYPMLEIQRCPKRGQPASLNFLFSKVETEWAFHIEDDWEFRRGHFVRECLDIAQSDDRFRNVIVRGWDGVHVIDNGREFVGHYYDENARRPRGAVTDCWWYGYSLNPGLQHMPTIRHLGRYDETAANRKFDRPAAIQYREMGLKRVSTMTGYATHIGDLTPAWEM